MHGLSASEARDAAIYRAEIPPDRRIVLLVIGENLRIRGERSSFSIVAIQGGKVYYAGPSYRETFEDVYRSFRLLQAVMTTTDTSLSERLMVACACAPLRGHMEIVREDYVATEWLSGVLGVQRFGQIAGMQLSEMPARIQEMWIRCR